VIVAANDVHRVAIVGAGLSGCLLATLLAQRGLIIDLYERRLDPRVTGEERGRSINLAISARGLDALARIGLAEHALSDALPMRGRTLHPRRGELGFQPYSADGRRAINSISRSGLNAALLNRAEAESGVTVHFGHRMTDLDAESGTLTVLGPDGEHRVQADLVVGCDGAYSAVRRAVQFTEGFDFSQTFLPHGYKELHIPARDGDFALDPQSLHIWPRGSSMMIALPNVDRSFTCTLFWPKEGPDSFAALSTADAILDYFTATYPDAVPLMPTLADDFRHNPVGSLVTVRCAPWVRGRAVLLGDAAHAILPFFGQGANCAFEDCVVLDEQLADPGLDLPEALSRYQQLRSPNTDAIAEMAQENFVEMSDRVNSRLFQWQNNARHMLERRLPGRYVSRYELVSFTTLPYAEIGGRVRRQDRAVVGVAGAAVALIGAAGALGLRALRRR
jgi:kynurenine 3-monooxygenase